MPIYTTAPIIVGNDPFQRVSPNCATLIFEYNALAGYPDPSPNQGIGYGVSRFGPDNLEVNTPSSEAFYAIYPGFAFDCSASFLTVQVRWFGESPAHDSVYTANLIGFDGFKTTWRASFDWEAFDDAVEGPCTYDEEGNCLRLNPELGGRQYLSIITPICEVNCARIDLSDPTPPPPTTVEEVIARYPWGVVNGSSAT
jgi:hypothetical protein